jgi:hypothetical protein
MASTNKCLARSNKSRLGNKATKAVMVVNRNGTTSLYDAQGRFLGQLGAHA